MGIHLIPAVLPDLLQKINPELRTGEKVIWADKPLPGLYGRRAIGIFVFGIIWTAFSIFWIVGTSESMSPWSGSHGTSGTLFKQFDFFPYFGVLPLVIGVVMLLSPMYMQIKAAGVIYAVTSQRAIVFEKGLLGGSKVQTFMPGRLTSITRKERHDGSGDLIFEEFTQPAGSGTTTIRRGFFAISDVRDVESLITTTLLEGRTREIWIPRKPF